MKNLTKNGKGKAMEHFDSDSVSGEIELGALIRKTELISAQNVTPMLWLQTVCDTHILGQTSTHRFTDHWTFTSVEH